MTETKKPNRLRKYKENPFTQELVLSKRSKQVKVSQLGSKDNILVNTSTGEVQGTHVVTYKQVDDAEFIKLFTKNISLAFDLSSAGNKAFCVMIFSQQKGVEKDYLYMDELVLEAFLAENPDKTCSMKTLYRGIGELEKAKILAKSTRPGVYFVNPSFTFNGDRVAFTTALERKKTKKKEVSDKQQTLI